MTVAVKLTGRSRSVSPRKPRPRRFNPAPLLLLPSFLIVSLFVYVFIGYTAGVSISKNWRPAKPDLLDRE